MEWRFAPQTAYPPHGSRMCTLASMLYATFEVSQDARLRSPRTMDSLMRLASDLYDAVDRRRRGTYAHNGDVSIEEAMAAMDMRPAAAPAGGRAPPALAHFDGCGCRAALVCGRTTAEAHDGGDAAGLTPLRDALARALAEERAALVVTTAEPVPHTTCLVARRGRATVFDPLVARVYEAAAATPDLLCDPRRSTQYDAVILTPSAAPDPRREARGTGCPRSAGRAI